MQEVKRKRPWEEETSSASVGQTITTQIVICIIIIGGMFFLSKTKTNHTLLIKVDSEIKKQLTVDKIYHEFKELKDVAMNYVITK